MQLKVCKYCGALGRYVFNNPRPLGDWHLADAPEHWVECKGCDYKTDVWVFSQDAVKEWNSKKDRHK